ncbi:Transcription factor AP-4, partial [Zootermopsis nevadensis]
SPSSHMEQEKRIRREIANSNERRRMQSINAGFQSLRILLPHHEGEKLSKAAILQQTAEYIYQLEQEKTSLLSQNCQLKRLINQHEGQQQLETTSTKKRKVDSSSVVVPLTAVPATVSESSDEGIGSMSPEPVAVASNASVATINSLDGGDPSREMIDLRVQLDRERRLRMQLEDQVRSLESQLYPERIREITQHVQLQYHHHQEVLEHSTPTITVAASSQRCRRESQPTLPTQPATQAVGNGDNLISVALMKETAAAVAQLQVRVSLPPQYALVTMCCPVQVVSAASLPPVAQNTTIVSTSPLRLSLTPPPASPAPMEPESPCSPPPPPISPSPPEQRLPSVLEAAIKAEPKVEVERLPSPTSASDDVTPQARLYLASTSRQNLETIVEAIRHLEGDHLFSDDPSPRCGQQQRLSNSVMDEPAQEVPLALTMHNKPVTPPTQTQVAHRLLKVEMNPFLQFHSSPQSTQQRTALQQQRPGVIVVKQHT